MLILPRLQGQGWSVFRRPKTSTRIATHVSGREVRAPLWTAPLYEFELKFEALSSDALFPGVVESSLDELQGFYLACGGTATPFLYVDPSANAAAGQVLGVGDGVTTSFSFSRAIGSRWREPVSYVTSVAAVTVAGAGVTGWTLVPPARLALTTAPAAGAVVAADFSYGFLCRFVDDVVELEHFMRGLWSMGSLKFTTFR